MSNKRTKIIFKKIRDANLNYNLINDNDNIAVGISGGKDSMVMLYMLSKLKKYTPLNFSIYPIYIDMGFNAATDQIQNFIYNLGFELHIEETNIGQIVFESRQEKNPCGLCSHLRRGALNRVAKKAGCNKLALGHHADDAVCTMLLSMLFEGHYQLFKPLTYLDRLSITVIRPMVYVSERDIEILAQSLDIPVLTKSCPADGTTKRSEVELLLKEIETRYPGAKQKLLRSIENVNSESFWSTNRNK